MGAREKGPERYLAGLARFGWHLGLDRIAGLLETLGHPERAFAAVQVAGTNGKGSTAATLASLLSAAGYRTGLYTSPHLVDYRERLTILERVRADRGAGIRLVRRNIPNAEFERVLRQVAGAAAEVGRGPAGIPTEFEVLTAAACLWFARERVEVAVLETGLGGRLDATTAVPAVLSVLTHIDLDHTDRLGPTLEAIAAEKAAIVRPGRPVVVAPQACEAQAVIERRAAEQGAPLIALVAAPSGPDGAAGWPADGTRAGFRVDEVNWRYTSFTYYPPEGPAAMPLRTVLVGRHQAVNTALALTAARSLGPVGFSVGWEEAREGLLAVRWPGRFEVLRRRPPVVVDGGHNPDGVRRLCETWRELSPTTRPLVVCGFLRDKAVAEMVDLLAGLAGEVIVTSPASDRAADPAEVAGEFLARGIPAAAVPDPARAARRAFVHPAASAGLLGCGSLYLIGTLRREWRAGGKGGDNRGV